MKRVSIIGSVGLPAKYGGWETLVNHLVENLSKKCSITVFCSSKKYSIQQKNYKGANLKYINLNPNGVQSILYDIISMISSLKIADTILVLGISGCIFLPILKLIKGRTKVIVNIDGLEWKRDKWGVFAKNFLKLSEFMAVKFSDEVVADNKIIKKYILDKYKRTAHLIPYGGDHVSALPLSKEIKVKYPFLSYCYAFSVCRIEPENNIHVILSAFEKITNKSIVIIGNWENSKYGIDLKKKYMNYKNIFLIDPIYDQEILNQIRSNCYIYIHGHEAGGTNPSLVEAMSLKLPVCAFDISYNRETTKKKAIYFKDVSSLVEMVENTETNKLNSISRDLFIIANDEYKWNIISKKYYDCF